MYVHTMLFNKPHILRGDFLTHCFFNFLKPEIALSCYSSNCFIYCDKSVQKATYTLWFYVVSDHVIPMWCPCDAHVKCMSSLCDNSWCSCDLTWDTVIYLVIIVHNKTMGWFIWEIYYKCHTKASNVHSYCCISLEYLHDPED